MKRQLMKLHSVRSNVEPQSLYRDMIEADQVQKESGVSSERLLDLAKSGFAPCLWIDDKGPFFRRKDIVPWIKSNLVRLQEPKPLLLNFRIVNSEPAMLCDVPSALKQFSSELKSFPSHALTAIYFLIKDDSVVYVGQSTSLASRIATHEQQKEFDRVLYIPLPRSVLNDVESALIRILKPALNSTHKTDPTQFDFNVLKKHLRIEAL